MAADDIPPPPSLRKPSRDSVKEVEDKLRAEMQEVDDQIKVRAWHRTPQSERARASARAKAVHGEREREMGCRASARTPNESAWRLRLIGRIARAHTKRFALLKFAKRGRSVPTRPTHRAERRAAATQRLPSEGSSIDGRFNSALWRSHASLSCFPLRRAPAVNPPSVPSLRPSLSLCLCVHLNR